MVQNVVAFLQIKGKVVHNDGVKLLLSGSVEVEVV